MKFNKLKYKFLNLGQEHPYNCAGSEQGVRSGFAQKDQENLVYSRLNMSQHRDED